MTFKKALVNSPYQLEYLERKGTNAKRLFLLLHGYAQDAHFVMDKLSSHLPAEDHIVAVNGPFPLPSNFPLSNKRDPKTPLLQKFAWYFFDAVTKTFPIDYSIPADLLNNFLLQYNKENLPITIIGYSQGGYLTIFVGERNKQVDHIIGINCSWRFDKLQTPLTIRVDSLNGDCDVIVEPGNAKIQHMGLIAQGASGKFFKIEREGHKLSEKFIPALNQALDRID